MGVQAIYQNIFPEVLGETKVLYCPMTTVEVSRTLWSFTKLREGGHFLSIALDRWHRVRKS
jgi:hypothetical protein